MNNPILHTIQTPDDVRKLRIEQLPQLASELRAFIIDIVATKEGHLGASLGVVELTLALHYVFDTPNDLLVWDVGHQAYVHKIITGRKDVFDTNRQLGGISGFPKRSESEFDTFGVGHSSTSISAALGMALASLIQGHVEKHHIAVIGDASIASGMAFEGLNHAGVTDANLLIILNDNAMGIDPSVGALKNYLTAIKKDKRVRKHNLIEALNFDYSGPIDGHDIPKLIAELQRLKSVKGPKFLHIITTKGKGLQQAEEDQVKYHAPGKFDAKTGNIPLKTNEIIPPKYQDVFGETLVELAEKNPKIVGITPAMPTGSSMNKLLTTFPNRAFDVGIAEQHAVTLAAGMVTQGLIPFCTIYSTFLQRAYDQIIHDVALQNLPVIFCLDRAGLVGEDGATHHGVFDIAYLRCIPNLIIYAPMDVIALRNVMYTAQLGLTNPIAIRYPRGRGELLDWKQPFKKIEIGKGECLKEGEFVAILTVGPIGNTIKALCKSHFSDEKIAHYNMQFIKPLDEMLLHKICRKFKRILTIEDGTIIGGFGSAVGEFIHHHGYTDITVKQLGVPDRFIEHGKTEELYKSIEIDPENLIKSISSFT
ncbi:1-deoxy-D-xylulose-5-phosphate synthase [Flavobacteriaceae bacterium F08102]|nr:1-deoxy-D-xylulose-5-phosphate synthase [Flavobacteriaceae bacterium F08102]